MADLQQQARALGDPTRYAIFRLVAAAPAGADVSGLTATLGLNHNAIRQHLAKLVAAGLVEESAAATGRPGRPRLVYRVHPSADSRWGVAGPYERLSALLAEVIRTGDAPEEVGRRYARGLVGVSAVDGDGLALLRDAMAREGFEPALVERGGRTEVVLHTCPFETAAATDRDSICRLHLGMAEGVAEATGGRVVVDELVAHDPHHARCRLRVHVGEPGEAHVAAPRVRFTGRR